MPRLYFSSHKRVGNDMCNLVTVHNYTKKPLMVSQYYFSQMIDYDLVDDVQFPLYVSMCRHFPRTPIVLRDDQEFIDGVYY